MPDEERITQEVNTRMAYTGRIVGEMDATRLGSDEREIFSSIQDFLAKAREALATKDLPRAQILADKAAKLADDLAASLRKSR